MVCVCMCCYSCCIIVVEDDCDGMGCLIFEECGVMSGWIYVC